MEKQNPAPLRYDGKIVAFGVESLRVETIPVWLARAIVQVKHYSQRFVNNSTLHLGVFSGREMVGVLQFGYALNPNSGRRVVEGTMNDEYLELNRMWIHDKMPRNTESRVLRFAVKFIKITRPKVQWIQTFADERCGGLGVVYQASNFLFVGSHLSQFYELDGDWYHKLAMTNKKGGARGRHLQANVHRATKHKFRQFRYIFFLKKSARKRLNFKVSAYPKREQASPA